ncbi:MAG: enoyl-CoA hydratase/isomerase family protein [Alphaproteobacteria bacterium]
MMSESGFRISHNGKIAHLILDRPEKHNAFDDVLISNLTTALENLNADSLVRIVVLAAEGLSFSAGGDLAWMRRAATYNDLENLADARSLAKLIATLDRMAKPTIAAIQGPAYGGGCGLIAACDIAIAVESAVFALTEVRLGLIPAVISPYVTRAIGQRQARRLFLTAEKFSADEAYRIGFIHKIVTAENLEEEVDKIIDLLLLGGPQALVAAKQLVSDIGVALDQNLIDATAQKISEIRKTPEGREGVGAFLEKRKPTWTLE